ncbi:filamin-A-like isoform X3 [Physella acuta]|uniref:filamin-A-like isoform X3 n=1 Tax=Physella acuta TaxID=109671 RepID=UPI0027DE3A8B|nr:filamin-A-like isoform X3 [Physella acuta]
MQTAEDPDWDEEEEMTTTERELADDAQWKLIQKNTFSRWANEHLKTVNKQLADLESDFSDGLRLVSLVEVLSGKKFKHVNKRPNFRTQKLENVTMVLKFLEEDEGIRIVNIDSTDIVDKKLKLILGLIWTLILHYSISMPMWEGEEPTPSEKAPTPKQRLLNWIQSKCPDLPINNFTTDWNDGKAIGALVDAVGPGLCPDWEDWDPKKNKANAKEAMDAAEKWLDVPQLIRPEEMTNPKVDDLSMMTYLSQFPNAKLKPGAPVRPRLNPSRVRAYGPGLEPTGNQVGAPARFTVETFSAGKGSLEIIVLNPKGAKENCEVVFNNDRNMTYSCVYVPTQEGAYRVIVKFSNKEIPKSPYTVQVEGAAGDPTKVTAAGPGIEKTGVIAGKKTYFEVYTQSAGKGTIDVAILDPHGHKDKVRPAISPVVGKEGTYLVEYTAMDAGLHSVNVFFSGQQIPGSPFGVNIAPASNAKACYATGRGIQPRGIRVKDNAVFYVHTKGAGDGEVAVQIFGPGGVEEKCQIKPVKGEEGVYECIYVPSKQGNYIINVTFADQHINKSPFKVEVGPFWNTKIRAYGPGLEGGVVNQPAVFTVETNGEVGALGFSIEGPSQAKIDCKDNGDGSADVTYWPTQAGEYAVHVLCNDQDIPNSPYMANIIPAQPFNAGKVIAKGPGLEKTGVQTNKVAEFTVDTRAAGKAPLVISCMDVDYKPVNVEVKDNGNGTYTCRYQPTRNVKHTVTITFGGVMIPNAPFRVYVSEPSNPAKVKVFGPGVEKGVKTFSPTHFVVDCKDAGPGDVAVGLTDERGVDVPVKTIDNQDGTFTVEYEPKSPGTYTVLVYFANKEVPQSPIKVKVEPNIDVSKVKVIGLEPRVYLECLNEFTVDARSVSPNAQGKVRAIVTSPSGQKTDTLVKNNGDGTYSVLYTPFEQGQQKIDVTYEDLPIPESPLTVTAVPGFDAKKVKAYGPGLEGGITDQPAVFTVDMKGAGKGGLGLGIEGPVEAPMQCQDNHDGTCQVVYQPTKAGPYDITVKFNEQHVPGSPFRVDIKNPVNPAKVKCYGPGLDSANVRAGAPATFTVDTTEAGEAPLEVTYTDKTGAKRPAQLVPVDDGIYEATYVPTAEGPCQVEVKHANQQVPHSPFRVNAQPGVDASKVKVTGPGVSGTTPASLPAHFKVDTRGAGDADLEVLVRRPDDTYIRPFIQDNNDGTYDVVYTPEDLGVYDVTVKYGGQNAPGSPFNVKATPTGDASKCKITDGNDRTVPVGKETVITVDASQAGVGKVTCRIRSPSGSDIDIDIIDQGDGTFSISFTPQFAGPYTIEIKFGGELVPNGSYTVEAVLEEEYQAYLATKVDEELMRADAVDSLHAQAPGSGLFQPVDFTLPVGPIFNFVSATVVMPSGKRAYPNIEDNKDGTVTVRYQPTETGLHQLHMQYNNEEIEGSPFLFHVEAIDSGYVTAYGPGLSHGVVHEQAVFTINTKNAGAGGLSLAIEGPSKTEIQCKDNEDGTCTVSYLPTAPGEYLITVKFADKHIAGSPFTAKVTPGEPRRKNQIMVGSSSEVSLKVTEQDIESLTASIVSPSGREEPCFLKRLANGHLGITFTPRETGEHLVNVYRNGQHIANSPFKITVGESEIGNASKVKVYGKGLEKGMANEVNEFIVDTREAGYGGMSLSIEGPSKADIECHDNEDGTCRVTYKPTEPGTYIINIKFADQHVPGSPFTVKIGGEPSAKITERITRHKEAADVTHVGSQCELSLKIPGTTPFDMTASVKSPSGVTELCDVKSLDDSHYSIKFVPKEMGVHTVSVKHKDMHIPGSPFEFTVGPIAGGGAHKVHASGPGLERGEVIVPNEFNIYTREAGAGGLSIAVEGPSKAEIDFQDKKDGSCQVSYRVSEPGEYYVSVKFNDEHIPDSPFRVNITPSIGDARKVAVQSLQDRGLQVGKPAAFIVNFNGAKGRLTALVVSPSGSEEEALVQEVDDGQYAVRFIPRENGVHFVHVLFDNYHIPESPFKICVGKIDADAGKVTAYGEGLVSGKTGQVAKFIVNTVNAGSGSLAVTVEGPSKVKLECREVEDGYEFSYSPTAPGDYLICIRYAGVNIAGSPFKAKIEGQGKPSAMQEHASVVVETVTKTSTTTRFSGIQRFSSDASKVTAKGSGLTQAFRGKPASFTVDASGAGNNIMYIGMMGPKGPCEELIVKHQGSLKYSVNYIVKDSGRYMLIIKWGDQEIPGSPFAVEVQ